METKYFVISLPRSGTTSICKMAKICGLSPNHAPSSSLRSRILRKNEFNFFSDTPVFCPTQIQHICDTNDVVSKFIYIDRDFSEIFDSWKRVKLLTNYERMCAADLNEMRVTMKFDLDSYNDAFNGITLNDQNYNEVFQTHKEKVIEIVNENKKDLLIYNFNDGWKPFCDFIGCDMPNEDIPLLNKDKMFDKI